MAMTVEEFCQSFPELTRSTDRSHISAWLDVTETRRIPAGETLVQEDATSDTFYMLLDGSLKVTMLGDDQILILGKIGKGGYIGESTMLDNVPALTTVTAETDSTLLALSDENFWKLDKQNPAASTSLLRSLSHIMSDRIRVATELISPLLDSSEGHADPANFSVKLGNAYANLYGLGDKP